MWIKIVLLWYVNLFVMFEYFNLVIFCLGVFMCNEECIISYCFISLVFGKKIN